MPLPGTTGLATSVRLTCADASLSTTTTRTASHAAALPEALDSKIASDLPDVKPGVWHPKKL
jgi:hypothetical protein